jgi:hypothetical protein
MSEFPQVNFVAETNFKNDLLALVHESDISWGSIPPYMVVFMTDDTICTVDFSMKEVLSALAENEDCLGFSLRLGLNCNTCFPYNCKQDVPHYEKVKNNVLKFNWQTSQYDFGYPLELSSSAYRIQDILEILEDCKYGSPNYLESCMANAYIENKPNLLMFKKSVAFSCPLNIVQSSHRNRNANYNPDTFRLIYEKGGRIDIGQFDNYQNHGAHEIPHDINFVRQDE